jgi:Tfp pilus assembly protein PilN
LVERNLAKVEVASSSLVSRSKFLKRPKLRFGPFCFAWRQMWLGVVLTGARLPTRRVARELAMDMMLVLLMLVVVWHVVRRSYQQARIAFLGRHLANLQLEQHMKALTEGYTRAIQAETESRQQQILDTFAPTERAVAAQIQTLADAMQKESDQDTRMSALSICVPYAERFLPIKTRDFRELLRTHANGLRYAVDNVEGWDAKTRAFHLSAELYLFQHSCHWFCRSRVVADARLMARHKLSHQRVLESVSNITRAGFERWLQS